MRDGEGHESTGARIFDAHLRNDGAAWYRAGRGSITAIDYATALRRCEGCQYKKACRDWLDYAPAMVNFAPDFCRNADILFDLQYDEVGTVGSIERRLF